jgi:dolichol-phosphate mannosyltransferase
MPELTLVVPTFNERGNIEPLIARLRRTLAATDWEIVFVDDDSPDGTASLVRDVAQADGRIRCIQRIGRRGLSSAVVEGILSSSAPYVAVMDADLQHDETLLPAMLQTLKADALDIVVGSRYVQGGAVGDWDRRRLAISRLASCLGRIISRADLADPMSGFFMIRRDVFDAAVRRVSALGFKIMLDLFASAPRPLRFRELPYAFRQRLHGESKLDSFVVWSYLLLILDKWIGQIVPVRFAMFGLVGGLGMGVHLTALGLLHRFSGLPFVASQAVATMIAMTFNFLLNNNLTYRDRRLHGVRLLMGLFSFCLACSVGLVANVGIASFLFERRHIWWLAGLAGALVGAVWNYAATSLVTWPQTRGVG